MAKPTFTITRLDATHFRVTSDIYMSDHTYRGGVCTLEGTVLRFPGCMNALPFTVGLGEKSYAAVVASAVGETVTR